MADPTYTLQITKQEPNPKYDVPGGHYSSESPMIDTEHLLVTITEAQFQAIRKAVLEQF